MGRFPRSASPSTGKRGLIHRLLPAIVLLAAVPFAESVRLSIVTDDMFLNGKRYEAAWREAKGQLRAPLPCPPPLF